MDPLQDPAVLAGMATLAAFSITAVIAAALLALGNRNRHP